jgi:hypothetical protein
MPPKRKALPARPISSEPLLEAIRVDDASVYLIGNEHGPEPRLHAVPLAGGEPRFLVGPDDPHLYLAQPDGERLVAAAQQQLVQLDRAGGPLERLATLPSGHLWAIELAGPFIYGTLPATNGGGLFRIPRDGGDVTWLARGRPTGLAVRDGIVAVANEGSVRLLDEHGAERAVTPAVADDAKPETPGYLCFVGDEIVFTTTGGVVAWHPGTGARRTIVAARASDLARVGDTLVYTTYTSKKTDPWMCRVRVDEPGAPEGLVYGRSKGGAIAVGPTALAWLDDWDGGAFVVDLAALP